MDLIPGMQATASALEAQKTRLEAITQNIANANTTRGPDGLPYQRQVVSFSTMLDETGSQIVQVSGVGVDPTPGPAIHNPSHPHADANGMVHMPNVSMSVEMVDMMLASRAYEANLSAAKTARKMAEQALEIGR